MVTEGVCGAVLMEFSSSPFAEETNNNYDNCHFGGICTGKLHCKLIFDRIMEKLLFKPLFLHLENIFLESLVIYFKHVLHKPAAVEGHCSLLQCCSFPTSIHPNFRLLCYCQQLLMREINLNQFNSSCCLCFAIFLGQPQSPPHLQTSTSTSSPTMVQWSWVLSNSGLRKYKFEIEKLFGKTFNAFSTEIRHTINYVPCVHWLSHGLLWICGA